MKRIYLLEDKGFRDFSPTDVGREGCESCHTFGPHIRNYYLIHFVLGGSGTFKNNRGVYSVGAGEAFMIRPGEVTTYRADLSDPWEYVWLGFRGALSSEFDNFPDVFEYDNELVSGINDALDLGEGREAVLAGIVFRLYASFIGERTGSDYASKVKGYIDLHYMEDISITAIADSLGLNRKYLARIFKERSGTSMQEYLISKRLHEGKKLLRRGYNVEQSAYMVGYPDQFGFSKAFKRKYGVPPSEMKVSEVVNDKITT